MKRILVASCWMGLASYCMIAMTLGPSGILASRKALEASMSMRENLSHLAAMNSSFSAEWEALKTSPEAIALEARSLGYLADDEIAVRLPDAALTIVPPNAGKRIEYEPQSILSEADAKGMALIIALMTAIAGLGMRLLRRASPAIVQRDIRTHEALRT
ncbi:MAG: hypothetical protein RBT62_01670 [Spirochaetia bacterium]|nr:hypothetical protein [Spirochaetia bacterium]